VKPIRILLVDDHIVLVEALRTLLEPDFNIVGTAADGRTMVEMALELKPDVVLLDLSLPVLNGLEAAQQLKKKSPEIAIVFLTMNEDRELAAEAMRIGAAGYVLKKSAASELRQAIRLALKGSTFVTASVDPSRWPKDNAAHAESYRGLTARQREVLQLLAEGLSMKEVGRSLGLTARTVAFHKYRIMESLGLQNSSQLVKYAIRHHIIRA
jgi:DNA-binding NarL/FixJ family response regulator